ncbi:MAG: peptide-methionine (S)-S-oxide reductase MsrA [Proteobacteria bacterium]|nr:peptide-methionine (S)-S-oxide reductase MsrA [Pseudomonadota bacterium]
MAGKGNSEIMKKLEGSEEGYSAQSERQLATFAAGCFWGVEEILRKIPGIVDTEVGYTGGKPKNPTYDDVITGRSGHAEAVQVVFDPSHISYEELLRCFFRLHDPTTLHRQGHDVGSQYRSAIFFHSDEQQDFAKNIKDEVARSEKWNEPIVTEIVPADTFYPAEDYHQDYLVKNPRGYTCHYLRD